jgi:tRNA uridine 5-carbamoylmethylation protein Kti12
MIQLIVLCGIPGSGKSTISKQLAEEHNATCHSFDELRLLRRSDFIPYIKDSLESNNNVVADAPHTDKKTRLELLNAIKHVDCKRILVFMNTPFDECVRRNAQRKNPLPFFILKSFEKELEIPTLDEGWDEILYY